jgi:transglutaminase-like putative cysteine protease
MRFAVRHSTIYEYGGDVVHSHHLLHLKPRDLDFQRRLKHSIALDPEPTSAVHGEDAFGNPIARLEYDRPHDRLSVIAKTEVEVMPRHEDLPDSDSWEEVRSRLSYHAAPMTGADLEACRFRMQSSHVHIKQALGDYAKDCLLPGLPVAKGTEALTRKIRREFKYVPGSTTNRTPIIEVLKTRRGVCQDFAHLMIGCLRSSGLAARYVSGYIRTSRAGGNDLVGGDASHAWVSVYCPPTGWVDFDPTNDCRVSENHVTVAWGRDFGDVSPLRGMIVGGGSHKLTVNVSVRPLRAAHSNTG